MPQLRFGSDLDAQPQKEKKTKNEQAQIQKKNQKNEASEEEVILQLLNPRFQHILHELRIPNPYHRAVLVHENLVGMH
jgi:hypothetical protein